MFEKNEYSKESIRTALTHIFDRGDGQTAKPMSFMHSFYDFFIDGIESGLIKHHNGRRYTQRTIDIWKAFGPTLKSYSTAKQTLDDIDRLFIDGFRLFLENKGYMETTINQAVSQFRRLCRMAADYEVNNNHTSRRSFITNLYKSGKLDDRQIMTISGHQTMKVYEEYIRMSTAEQARRIYERMKE